MKDDFSKWAYVPLIYLNLRKAVNNENQLATISKHNFRFYEGNDGLVLLSFVPLPLNTFKSWSNQGRDSNDIN